MKLTQKKIIWACMLSEGSLLILYALWTIFRLHPTISQPNYKDLSLGLFYTLPLLLVNLLLFGFPEKISFLRIFREFRESYVMPLAFALSWPAALFVSISAGVAEELFFRGCLHKELGWLIASVLFSAIHFGKACKKYIIIAFLYFLIGAYLSLLLILYDSLWIPIISHTTYDFLAIISIKKFYGSS